MAGLALTNKTVVAQALPDAVGVHLNPGPYQILHVRTAVDLLLAVNRDPDSDSFRLARGSAQTFYVEPGEELRFRAESDGGEVRISTLASGDAAAERDGVTRAELDAAVGEVKQDVDALLDSVGSDFDSFAEIAAGLSGKVSKSGDTMTGALTISAGSVITLGPTNIKVDNSLGANSGLSTYSTTNWSCQRSEATANPVQLTSRKSRGSVGSESPCQAGDAIYAFRGESWDGAAGAFGPVAILQFIQVDDGAPNRGVRLQINGAPIGTNLGATTSGGGLLFLDHAEGLRLFGISNTVIDQNRHHRLRAYTIATLPAASPAGQIIYVSDLAGGGGVLVSDGTVWRRARETGTATISTDAGHTFAWDYLADAPLVRGNATLTDERNVTLNTTGAANGARARFVRLGAGAFNWVIAGGTSVQLTAANQWCEFEFDGSAWNHVGTGAL